MSLVYLETPEPQGDENEDNYDDDEEEEAELSDSDESESEHPPAESGYKTSHTQVAVKIGGTQLSYAEAKLYGLLDENGKLKRKMSQAKPQKKPEDVSSSLIVFIAFLGCSNINAFSDQGSH
jgi:hypothetical protein